MKSPVLHACDNTASILCLRDLHGAPGSSCSSLWQHFKQQTAHDTIQGKILIRSLDNHWAYDKNISDTI